MSDQGHSWLHKAQHNLVTHQRGIETQVHGQIMPITTAINSPCTGVKAQETALAHQLPVFSLRCRVSFSILYSSGVALNKAAMAGSNVLHSCVRPCACASTNFNNTFLRYTISTPCMCSRKCPPFAVGVPESSSKGPTLTPLKLPLPLLGVLGPREPKDELLRILRCDSASLSRSCSASAAACRTSSSCCCRSVTCSHSTHQHHDIPCIPTATTFLFNSNQVGSHSNINPTYGAHGKYGTQLTCLAMLA